ncbi:MAG: Xaa-Pro peptidase family protein [candidate division KSB1 bacterium]|nr:Xaa-Pro peptidase family protein [candidate division KSB1 bacterium]
MFDPYRRRVAKLQELMVEKDVDLFIIVTPENYLYFSGDVRRQPRMLIPASGDPALIVFASEVDEVRSSSWVPRILPYRALHEMMLNIIGEVSRLGKERPRIGLEVGFHVPSFLVERFRISNPTAEVVQERTLIEMVRKTKDAEEIQAIRKASELADKGMELVAAMLRPGLREKDLALELDYQLRKMGADGLGFPPFVNSGYRSLWLHGLATDKSIEKGELVLVDFAPVYQGYYANISRTFVVGRPLDEHRRAMGTYVQIHRNALESLRPGIPLFEVEQRVEDHRKSLPYGEYLIRGLIHGIGLAFEEFPFPTIFPEDVMATLDEGMTLAVGHPVLSVPGLGGFKQEDTVLLTSEGPEVLTHFRSGLIEV